MNIWWIIFFVFIGLAFFAIKKYFDYKKVAVKTKNYDKTLGMTYLFFAFMAITSVLSLSDKLLNLLLKKLGITFLEQSQFTDYKLMLIVLFIIFAVSIILILNRNTNLSHKQTLNSESADNKKVMDHFVVESERKNREIDDLKEKLRISLSEEEKLKLSNEINQLEVEIKKTKREKRILEELLEEFSKDVEIVQNINEVYKLKGIDEAIDYSESINFDKALKDSIEYSKAALIKANFHAIKNDHEKANKAFLMSIGFDRNYYNVSDYIKYLFDQNEFDEVIKQLSLLQLENKQILENHKASIFANLATAYQKNFQFDEAESAYNKSLEIYRNLAKSYPDLYKSSLADILNNMAVFLYRSGTNLNDSKKAFDEALEIRREQAKLSPSKYQPIIAILLTNLGNMYRTNGNLAKAEQAYDESLQIRRKLSESNPQIYLSEIAVTLNNLSAIYVETDRFKDSETVLNESLEIRRELSKSNPSAYQPDVATTLNNLVSLYYFENRLEEAGKAFYETIQIRRMLYESNPSAYGIDLANTLVMGFDYLNQPIETLNEAKTILDGFHNVPEASRLLSLIETRHAV